MCSQESDSRRLEAEFAAVESVLYSMGFGVLELVFKQPTRLSTVGSAWFELYKCTLSSVSDAKKLRDISWLPAMQISSISYPAT